MHNGKKKFLAVLIDLALLATLLAICYFIVFRDVSEKTEKILKPIIASIIPIMFYVSYQAFAGDKFDYDESKYEKEFGDDEEEE